MAKSRFEYVRNFELPDPLVPETFIVVRIDGRGFHKFSDAHDFEKPNDVPALDLMNRAARAVMDDLHDVVMAFGESDEFSFLIRKRSNLYSRRRSKINSAVCSIFTSAYVFYWNQYLPERPLRYPPIFDSRVVLYPSAKEVRDYFSWRQADTHINNLYNTCFWFLVKSGLSTNETNRALQGTDSKDKNEMLFSRFGVNYNKLPEMFRKGSILVREERTGTRSAGSTLSTDAVAASGSGPPFDAGTSSETEDASTSLARLTVTDSSENSSPLHTPGEQDLAKGSGGPDTEQQGAQAGREGSVEVDSTTVGPAERTTADGRPIRMRQKKEKKPRPYEGLTGDVVVLHLDIIGDAFWNERPWLLQ